MPTALITGAGGGIGSAIATALAPTHTLLLAGRPSDRLDAVADRLDATTFPLDLTDAGAIDASCEIVDALDVLVHNAGVSIPGHVAESSVERQVPVVSDDDEMAERIRNATNDAAREALQHLMETAPQEALPAIRMQLYALDSASSIQGLHTVDDVVRHR